MGRFVENEPAIGYRQADCKRRLSSLSVWAVEADVRRIFDPGSMASAAWGIAATTGSQPPDDCSRTLFVPSPGLQLHELAAQRCTCQLQLVDDLEKAWVTCNGGHWGQTHGHAATSPLLKRGKRWSLRLDGVSDCRDLICISDLQILSAL